MDVVFQGIKFTMENPSDRMWDMAFPIGETTICIGKKERVLKIVRYQEENGDVYLLGLLITKKGTKHMTTAAPAENQTTVLEQITPVNPLADFNFFVVNQRTRRGVYQHYHGAAPASVFFQVIQTSFERKKADYIGRLDTVTAKKNAQRTVLRGALCLRKESFYEIVAELHQIKSMALTCAVIEEDVPSVLRSDIIGAVRQEKRVYDFVPNTVPSQIKFLLERFVPQAKRLRVEGSMIDGMRQIVDLHENIDGFGSMPYDALVADIPPLNEPRPLREYAIIDKLLQVARRSPFVNSTEES